MFQLVEDLSPDVEVEVHFYCEVCLLYYQEKPNRCTVCEKETECGEFYTFDVVKIIKFLFESRNLASMIDSTPQGDPLLIKDLQDGYVYKNLNSERGKYDVNLVLSTDGVRVRKGSSKELWLLMFSPVEVPPHARESYTYIIGVWHDKVKPRGNTFLKPFCRSLKAVENVGVNWKHPLTGHVHCSSIRITLLVADAPARAMCLNVMNFNSKNGCNICEITTQRVRPEPGKRRIRVYRYIENPVLRTKQRMHNDKGFSELSLLSSIDISQLVIPEFMHSVLLGVCRQIVSIWIEKPGAWSIANRLHEVDHLLSQIKHPSFVHRTKRSLQDRKLWKASDFYYFLLFESLVVLYDILPDVYYQHFILLVKSIFTLLKRGISDYDIKEAESICLFSNLLTSTLKETKRIISTNFFILHCVSNGLDLCHVTVHFHLKVSTAPLPKAVMQQIFLEIVNNIKIYQGVVVLRNISKGYGMEQSLHDVQPKVLGKKRQIEFSVHDTQFFGNEKPDIYSRAHIGYDLFTSEIYKVLNSANFHGLQKRANKLRLHSATGLTQHRMEKCAQTWIHQ
ncbi:LOW QUALITY PROTEIN: hypothetical protein KUF71_017178 [Frankliniella fusca]|uniref:Uncharacterized protein n=1 Tax=Frankliniella fusca TaxID=407009 RepID=A0AAE1LVB5_9NEOP|nr:LOW QUALITY PROTEIN: hypothetical protein KUF71_017178 [Frankliniella fusca]